MRTASVVEHPQRDEACKMTVVPGRWILIQTPVLPFYAAFVPLVLSGSLWTSYTAACWGIYTTWHVASCCGLAMHCSSQKQQQPTQAYYSLARQLSPQTSPRPQHPQQTAARARAPREPAAAPSSSREHQQRANRLAKRRQTGAAT